MSLVAQSGAGVLELELVGISTRAPPGRVDGEERAGGDAGELKACERGMTGRDPANRCGGRNFNAEESERSDTSGVSEGTAGESRLDRLLPSGHPLHASELRNLMMIWVSEATRIKPAGNQFISITSFNQEENYTRISELLFIEF